MAKRQAAVEGFGTAGLTLARRLLDSGWDVTFASQAQQDARVAAAPGSALSSRPTLVLPLESCRLLEYAWRSLPQIWNGAHVIEERRVAWGRRATLRCIRSPARVMAGDLLSVRLLSALEHGATRLQPSNGDVPPAVTTARAHVVNAGGRASLSGCSSRLRYGRRYIVATTVELSAKTAARATWMETIPDGWVFLAPTGQRRATLQVMCPGPRPIKRVVPDCVLTMLEQTRWIRNCVGEFVGPSTAFDAFPSYGEPARPDGSLAVGEAAMAFDPICGDGTGAAVRGALLASAVLDRSAGGDSAAARVHYSRRLAVAFRVHLDACDRLYASFTTPDWLDEMKFARTICAQHGPARTPLAAFQLRCVDGRLDERVQSGPMKPQTY